MVLVPDSFERRARFAKQGADLVWRQPRPGRLDRELHPVGEDEMAPDLHRAGAARPRRHGRLGAAQQTADALERDAGGNPFLYGDELLRVRVRVVGGAGLADRPVDQAELMGKIRALG